MRTRISRLFVVACVMTPVVIGAQRPAIRNDVAPRDSIVTGTDGPPAPAPRAWFGSELGFS